MIGFRGKERRKVLLCTAAGAAVCILGGLSRCGGVEKRNTQDLLQKAFLENREAQHCTITLAGSTAMERLANMAAERFMELHPDVSVTVEFTGSSAGIESVLAGRSQIGNSSRELREAEMASGANGYVVALDGIAVITDASNPVAALTSGQLADLYTGKIRNWSKIGGDDRAVVPVGREAGSGTRCTFEEVLGIEDTCSYANELDSAGAVIARVGATPGAVGYVSFDVLRDVDTVHTLALDGVEATEENVKAGTYRLWMPLVMVTKGKRSGQTEAVQAFFAFLESEEGEGLIRAAGLILPDASNRQ